MKEFTNLAKFESEYIDEIKAFELEIKDLKRFKISDETLSSEIFLTERYGSEIFLSDVDEIDSNAKAQVSKIENLDELNVNEMNEIFKEITNSEANTFLQLFFSKVNELWNKTF